MPLPKERVEIIGSVKDNSISVEDILSTLEEDKIETAHGEQFTGRPVTTVIANKHYVIKLRREYKVDRVNSIQFCERAIKREAELNFYHPLKTWFIYFEEDDAPTIANITPRLQALHEPSFIDTFSEQKFLEALHTIFSRYLEISATLEKQLDLGLSNFGLDHDGHIYYVDDDIYECDNFLSLSQFLGVLIRSQTWINPQDAFRLGGLLRQNIINYFHDSHWCTVITEHLKSVFIPDALKVIHKSLVEGLHEGNTFSYKPQNSGKVIALIADIHANAPALEATMEYLSSRDIDHGLMLGDIVGYGPHPAQCIDILREAEWLSMIRGNHDNAVAQRHANSNMNSMAKWSIDWTLSHLKDEHIAWLDTLPPYIEDDNWLAVHGSPRDKSFFNAYVYKLTYNDNLDELATRGIRWCFHGHTHSPQIYYRSPKGDGENNSLTQNIDGYLHALICPGSVGQPRNQLAGAQLALIDLNTNEIEFHRIAYNLKTVVEDMQKNQFPQQLITRLIKAQ